MKKILKILGILLLILVIAVLTYVGYVYFSYDRIEDNQKLEVKTQNSSAEKVQIGKNYRIVSYNIGFGAYTQDFSFFMDGGESSRAKDKDSVIKTVTGSANNLTALNPDFAMIEEVDLHSTRSYHVNQYDLLQTAFNKDKAFNSTFAINYDSAYLFYPIQQPHGKSKSGIAFFAKAPITSSLRRSFPISTSFSKFFDLDRCYIVSRIPVENGKELVCISVHMSAYGHDENIRKGQIGMLVDEMNREYAKGNYVIIGGDFNHDLKSKGTNNQVADWAFPFPREELPNHFSLAIDTLSEEEKNALWDTCRFTDMPYIPGKTQTITLDGFILSDNIKIKNYDTYKTEYMYSDHEPVYMDFELK
ncbi:MAG: endonuclease/exonuclease/phosphatase family protein [Clostridia bacterium]|nr:endonuclease/exonuclease/phosphatase family protein [Clostridia bacterium]